MFLEVEFAFCLVLFYLVFSEEKNIRKKNYVSLRYVNSGLRDRTL